MVFQLNRRMKIAELKQKSTRPDVVEVRMVDEIQFFSHVLVTTVPFFVA